MSNHGAKLVPVPLDQPLFTTPAKPVSMGLSGHPTMMFAMPFSAGRHSLGLDAELELRGGDRLGPTGIQFDLGLEWAAGLRALVGEACDRQRVGGRPWFTMPPVLLTGLEGAGRTNAARQLARTAGLPHITFDLTCSMVGARTCGPDAAIPNPIATAIALSGCANPVVSVRGAHRASGPTLDLLVRMLDPETSGRFVDSALGAVLDLRQVVWIVQSRTHDQLPHNIRSRLWRVELEPFRSRDSRMFAVDVLAEVLGDLGLRDAPPPGIATILAEARSYGFGSTSALYEHLFGAVARLAEGQS
jgi:hypothetical protein